MTLLADLKQAPTAIIPACGDGHTFQMLANSKAPAIFLSGQLTTAFKHKEKDVSQSRPFSLVNFN